MQLWYGPQKGILVEAAKVGLEILYIRARPHEVYVERRYPSWHPEEEAWKRRTMRRIRLFQSRMKRVYGLRVELHPAKLLGPYTVCFYGYVLKGIILEAAA